MAASMNGPSHSSRRLVNRLRQYPQLGLECLRVEPAGPAEKRGPPASGHPLASRRPRSLQ